MVGDEGEGGECEGVQKEVMVFRHALGSFNTFVIMLPW